MKIEVLLIAETRNCTLSQLCIDGVFQCFVLEDGYREKKEYSKTRIPAGTYQVAPRRVGKFFTRYKNLYGHDFVPQLLNVPGFEYILIHMGNNTVDTAGCLLVGHAVAKGPTGDFLISSGSSKPAYLELYRRIHAAIVQGEAVEISMVRDPHFSKTPTV